MESADFSDLTLVCGEETFHVHRAVVSYHSPVMRAALKGSYQAPSQEAHDRIIKMDSFQPLTVKKLVEFMYTGQYTDFSDQEIANQTPDAAGPKDSDKDAKNTAFTGSVTANPPSPGHDNVKGDTDTAANRVTVKAWPMKTPFADYVVEHVRMNTIGHYYGIDALEIFSVDKIRTLSSEVDGDVMVESLPTLIEAAVESGDKRLHEHFATAAAQNFSSVIKSDVFRNMDIFSGFPFHLAVACAQEIEPLRICHDKLLKQHQTEIKSLKSQKLLHEIPVPFGGEYRDPSL
ncbi:hypothetical protein HIM_00705 [Hirsutella minnesotensis 3608]|nr:hypothetical protein HIM_00705 [Hirsutella minnesotensis 3608]